MYTFFCLAVSLDLFWALSPATIAGVPGRKDELEKTSSVDDADEKDAARRPEEMFANSDGKPQARLEDGLCDSKKAAWNPQTVKPEKRSPNTRNLDPTSR